MQPIGPIGKLQDLNLRDGDFVVCVGGHGGSFSAGGIYKANKGGNLPNDSGSTSIANPATFQRIHHHDPRCFGFEGKDTDGNELCIFTITRGLITGFAMGRCCEYREATCRIHTGTGGDLIPLTPPTEFEVLGVRFATRKEAEDAMVIKEVLK